MKTLWFTIVLTGVNLLILILTLFRASSAATQEVTPILRVRALELVDDRGRVRGELKVFPAEPTLKMSDGTTGYPETVLIRLITSNGDPNVKLSATEDGSGFVLGGESGYVQILSRGTKPPFAKIVTKDGRERELK